MDAAPLHYTAAAVRDVDRALATLMRYQSPRFAERWNAALLTLESARELLCDEREFRAVQLLNHARKVLGTLVGEDPDHGMVLTRYLESALTSLRGEPN